MKYFAIFNPDTGQVIGCLKASSVRPLEYNDNKLEIDYEQYKNIKSKDEKFLVDKDGQLKMKE